jgi:hypothetical protein
MRSDETAPKHTPRNRKTQESKVRRSTKSCPVASHLSGKFRPELASCRCALSAMHIHLKNVARNALVPTCGKTSVKRPAEPAVITVPSHPCLPNSPAQAAGICP